MSKKIVPDRETLQAAIKAEMENIIGKSGDTLSEARARLMDAYLGNPLGSDPERRKLGWSTYIDRTVMETVEWAKPALMRVFASYDDIVRFDPARPGQERNAAAATEYVNQAVFGQDSFRIVHDIIADALLQRIAWGVVYFEQDAAPRVVKEFTDLTEQEAVVVLAGDLSAGEDVSTEVEQDPKTGLYTVRIRSAHNPQPVRVEAVPSECVVWNSDARNMETCRFVAHWRDRTITELEAEGYSRKLLDELPDDSDAYPEADVQAYVNASSGSDETAERSGSMRKVRVYEAYILMADKGGGETRYKVVFCGTEGSVILSSEPWHMPRPPLFPVSSVPLPHQVGGLCLADLVYDIQMLRTELARQMLDSLALSNQGEFIVNEATNQDFVDMDQFLARRPAGVYRTRGNVSVTLLPTDSRAAQEASAALQMTDGLKESRTGVGMQMQGLQADALQNTATGAVIVEDSANQRLELIARILAEDFFKPVAQYVLLLVSRHQIKPMQAYMRGRFVPLNPAEWDPDMDVSVSVGLGTGNRSRQTQNLNMIVAYQEKLMASLGKASPVKISHVIHALHKMISGMGFAAPEQFVGSMEDAARADMAQAQGGQEPSPEEKKLQVEQKKAEAQIMLQDRKDQAEMKMQEARAAAEIRLEQAKAQSKMEFERLDAANEIALQREENAADLQLARERMGMEAQTDRMRMMLQGVNAPGTAHLRQENV